MPSEQRHLPIGLLAAVLALVLAVAACGGDDGEAPPSSPTATTPAQTSPTPQTPIPLTPLPKTPETFGSGCKPGQAQGEGIPGGGGLLAAPPQRALAFQEEAPAGKLAFVSLRDGNEEVYVVDTDGSGETNLTNNPASDFDPDWSPDGSRIAFVSDREGDLNIYVMQADGSGLQRLSGSADAEFKPRWSPDGQLIVYACLGASDILWLMNADGSGARPVSIRAPGGDAPLCADGGLPGGWSPDSQRITFEIVKSVEGQVQGQVCSVNLDGSGLEVLTDTQPPGLDAEPVVSADGQLIAFRSTRDTGDGGQGHNSEVYLMTIDGSDQRNLTASPANDIEPSWSPDSDWLAFASDREGNFDIYLLRPEDGTTVRVTENPAKDSSPAWQPR